MNETLQEYFDSRGVSVRVDREAGIIRGVKILGLESRNQRSYLPDALARAVPLYEGAKVNVNHPKGHPGGPRDYQDRLGTVRNVTVRPDEGLFGDLHFNPRHALAEQLVWDAEHAPENVGFSHNVEARTARRGQRVVVEAITRVQSVDLVADPATTRGLFEGAAGQGEPATGVAGITLEDLRRQRPDLIAEVLRESQAETARLREEVARLEALEAGRAQQATIRRLLREARLPDPDTSDPRELSLLGARFMESLRAAGDERAMRELIEERARLVQSLNREGGRAAQTPQSRDQNLVYAAQPQDAKQFVEAITR